MKPFLLISFLVAGLNLNGIAQQKPSPDKINIMLMGSTHFGQEAFHKQGTTMDLFSTDRQKEVADINNQIARYKPDMILIEREPNEQHSVDSLYELYENGKLQFNQLKYGRAEEYQFGFTLAKKLDYHIFTVLIITKVYLPVYLRTVKTWRRLLTPSMITQQ